MDSQLAKRVLTLERKIMLINHSIYLMKKQEEQYAITDCVTNLNILLETEMNKREQHNIKLYSCQCCNLITTSNSQYVIHTKSKKHIKNTQPINE
jgi:hypothetical protein